MPLYSLVKVGNTTVLRARLQAGEDVNQGDDRGRTALHGACCRGVSDDVLDLVLSYSPRLDERDRYGRTALHEACSSNKLGAVQRLITAGASVDVMDWTVTEGRTPLHEAAECASSSDVADVLLQAGADVHAVDRRGCTPLHWACCSSTLRDVHELLLYAIELPRSRDTNLPALNLPAVQALLSHGADVNTRDVSGSTPLLLTLRSQKPTSFMLRVIQLLCNHGADPYLCDITGNNALTLAEERDLVAVSTVLKKCKFIYESPR